MKVPILVESKCKRKGHIFDFQENVYRFVDGQEIVRDVAQKASCVGIVAVREDQKVCMVKQYRFGVDEFVSEIPAGHIDKGETPLGAAKRELSEETGLRAKCWYDLGEFFSSPGFTNERIYLFAACELEQGNSHPDEDEEIDIDWSYDLNTLFWQAVDGEIKDEKTFVALIRAYEAIGEGIALA